MKKNEEAIIRIQDLSVNGEGIGRTDEGTVLFVKDTVPGDLAKVRITKVKKTYGYARLMELFEASSDRVKPPCPVAGPCGGCQLQAMSYPRQLAFKTEKVRNNLQRIGGFTVDGPDTRMLAAIQSEKSSVSQNEGSEPAIHMEPIIGMEEPYHYRNKAQYPVGRDKNGRLIAGFYAGRTHSIIEAPDCMLGAESDREILKRVLSHMEKNGIDPYDERTHSGLVRHILIRTGRFTGEILVCIVLNGSGIPKESELADALFSLPGMTSLSVNENRGRTNVILGERERIIRGSGFITDQIGNLRFRISAKSFFQVNPIQTGRMYALAMEYAGLTGKETVWDLYCGAGTISLFLAQKAGHVYGVEVIPEAVRDARENAAQNGIRNVTFFTGKAEEIVPEFYRRGSAGREEDASLDAESMVRPDVIVVDPPRKGLDASLIDVMAEAAPDRIVYVSCDSATLARDLRRLSDRGYRVERVRPVDNFCQTVHVETVVLLSRVK